MSKPVSQDDGGFPLPAVIDPPRICITLTIPDEDAHLRAFWGALWELTRWFNWEFDEDKNAKKVADVWKEVWLENQANWRERECMPPDPCCPETNELLTAIRDLNQLIVNNQVTMINQNTTLIDNDTTIIEQNQTAEYNHYVTQYNQFVTNNQSTSILNQMLYDGTPQSIFPEAGEDFDSTGEAALCAAIDAYINGQIYIHTQQAALAAVVATGVTAVIGGLAAAFSLISAGTSVIIGAALSASIALGLQAWNDILNDTEARRKVRCCMFDALQGQALTRENFQTSADSCGFDSGTNESNLAAQIAHDNFNYPENWTAFLRAMQQSTGATGTENCNCECDTDEIVLIADNDCILTKIDATHWRIQQSNYTIPDPAHPENRDYTMIFREEFYRCFDVVATDFSLRYYYQTNCDGTEIEGLGGGGGKMIRATWINGQNQNYEAIDGIIEIACPEEE